MAKFVNINGKYIPFTNEQDLIKIQDREIERLNNIIKNLDKMFEYYFLGNPKYHQDTVNTIYIKYVKLKELKGEEGGKK